jgi:hypothetical protein
VKNIADHRMEVENSLVPARDQCCKMMLAIEATTKDLNERVLRDIQAGALTTANEVRAHFDSIHTQFQHRENVLLTELLELANDELQPIKDLKMVLQERHSVIRDMVSECDRALKLTMFDPRPLKKKIDNLLDFPVIFSSLPTSDQGIHLAGANSESITRFIKKYGTLENPTNKTERFCLKKIDLSEDSNVEDTASRSSLGSSFEKGRPRSALGSSMFESMHYETTDLIKGQILQVKVSFTETPTLFYVNRTSDIPGLIRLGRNLTRWALKLQGPLKKLTHDTLHPTYMYAAKWRDDGKYYRVRVLKVEPHPSKPHPGSVKFYKFLINF